MLEKTLYFFIIYALVFAITTPIAAKFAARYGMKHAILLSVPFFLLMILFLRLLPKLPIPIEIVGALLGLHVAFYWMGLHLIFYYDSDQKHRGEEFGKRMAFSVLGATLGPFIGGVLIKYVGFYSVFILTSIVLFLSAMFLFLSHDNHVRYHFAIRSLLDLRHLENALFFMSRGTFAIASEVIWPLMVFLILDDYLSLGMIGSLISAVSAILIWIVGKYSDHCDKRQIIRVATIFESASWIARAMVTTVAGVFGITTVGAIIYGVFEAPVGTLEYDKASRRDITEYFVSREIFINIGRIAILLFVLFTNSLSGGLVFHGIATLATFLF